jgi:predicted O-linked N-acetylglucosamine transferase (SPINDLY family)
MRLSAVELEAQLDIALQRGDLLVAKQYVAQLNQLLPHALEHWRTSALIDLHSGAPEAAIDKLRHVVGMAPTRADLRADFAALLELQGELAQAEMQLHEAIRLQPKEMRHHLKLAAVLLASGKAVEAAMLARQVVTRAPELQAGWHVLADCAFLQQDWAAALRSFQRAIELAAKDGAAAAKLWYNVGLCAQKLNAPERALQAFDQALALDAKLYAALAQRVFTQRKLGDWQQLEAFSTRLIALVKLGVPGPTPFSFLAEAASALDQLQCARTESAVIQKTSAAARAKAIIELPRATSKKSGAIRVGFVSNGFGQHPTGLLTVEFFEKIERSRLSVVLFSTAASDSGPIRQRLERAAPFCEISNLPAVAAATRVRELDIEVLFDLRGFGDGGVPQLFAQRPAPLQVNWLAYPGTSGAPWMDCIFADAHVLPDALRPGFSEAVLRLPGCFQPYDSHSRIATPLAREMYGLPDQAIVLASLNNSYKINPEVFAAWMEIMRACPNTVLWLLKSADAEGFAANIRAQAQCAGVAAQRVVFLAKSAHADYLAALGHADLFLDTFPYGAHTTARDALFVGCPVLTIQGETFAARVATSLNEVALMQAFNCQDRSHYVASAIALASAPEQLKLWRARLLQQRHALFDSAKFADNFSRAVEQIVQRNRMGLAPEDLSL